MARLEIAPKHMVSWDFDVREEGGASIRLDLAHTEKAEFELDGVRYRIRREGPMSGDWTLEAEGDRSVLARAGKVSVFRREYVVTAAGRRLVYRAAHPLTRAFVLLHGRREIGSLRPGGFLRRRAVAELPDELGGPIRIFLVFLALILWRRQARAAASGG